MGGCVNKVILIGNLGADPEIRRTQDGRPIANLRLATTDTWRDKMTGERRERTEWHRVVIFNENLAKIAEQYLKKGAKVYVEGQLTMLDRAGAGGGSAGGDFGPDDNGSNFGSFGGRSPARQPALAGAGMRDDMNDEVPF